MIIDCHGHYTTAPKPLRDWRQQQTDALKDHTKRYIDSIEWLEAGDREKIFHTNVRRVYGRYSARAEVRRA